MLTVFNFYLNHQIGYMKVMLYLCTMTHHTKDKGDQGVGFVIANLLSKNIQVCLPLSEHLPFDLIAVRQNGELLRVSVKYRKADKNGLIQVGFKSSYSDSKGSYTKKIDKSLIDVMAIYCPDTNKVYYVNPNEFGENAIIRITPTKNNQTRNVHLADNYLHL